MAARHPVKETDGAEATRTDVRHILGDLEEATVIEILALQPTVLDLDEAAVWLTGDGDRLDRDRRPLTGRAAEIFAIVAADEEEEPRLAR